MALLKKDQAISAMSTMATVVSDSPIIRCLMNIDEKTTERMKKFMCHGMAAKECLSFTKYPSLHELEMRHGVDLGPAYKTDVSAKSFTHYIADSVSEVVQFDVKLSALFSYILNGLLMH